ncbi:hypothetical protein [Lysinibacillus fusiformis]|uniref:hypothetical protein n=1 Tax=Lysinibacillus fusiformis TaxID=28031 RepID=UPI002E24A143|nr:hypothetical protein [Lysinibacillus fusiformis]
MFRYAQINDESVVMSISSLSGEVIADHLILINDLDVELDIIYNRDAGEFTPPEPTSIESTPTVEEMQAQTLLNTEYTGLLTVMNEQ